MTKVLITGHTGYIGSVMTRLFLENGYEVVGLDTDYFDGCDFGGPPPKVRTLRKDIRDVTLEDVQGVDAIAHKAALCNDPLGDLNGDWTLDINFRASVRLAELAKAVGVARFLYASSCSMYGAAGDDLMTEEAPLAPLTPYAESKVRTEEAVSKLADSGFSPIFLRNATAYGVSPRLRGDIVLNNLVCWAYTTGKVKIMSDGTPWRPIVHIEDISRAFLAVLEAPRDVVHNQPFNVGANRENYQVRDLGRIVEETVPNCVVEYAGQNNPDPRNYRVDFSKIARLVPGFQPQWTAQKGAEELYAACRANNLTLEQFQGRDYIRLKQFRHLLDGHLLDDTLRWKQTV
jgi:nucleoside-diphosphate-sugar epimerase